MARNDGRDVIIAVLGLGWGLRLFYRGFRLLQMKRTLAVLATSKVRSLAMGIVELEGFARPIGSLKDPIYQKPCAFYRLRVEEERGRGKHKSWVTIREEASVGRPFYLVDDTGRVAVFPSGESVLLRDDVNTRTGWLREVFSGFDADISRFLASVPESKGGPLRLTAQIIREGDPLCVVGYAAPADDPLTLSEKLARGVRLSLHEVARRLKADPTRMKNLDADGNGRVDLLEWDAGLKRFKDELEKEAAGEPPAGAVIRASPEGLLFFSDRSEKECIADLGNRSLGRILGGPALSLACAAYLAYRFKWAALPF